MAEENEEKTSEPEGIESQDNKKKEQIVTWSIMGGIVLVFALSGFFLGNGQNGKQTRE